jgi:hypothetical protein
MRFSVTIVDADHRPDVYGEIEHDEELVGRSLRREAREVMAVGWDRPAPRRGRRRSLGSSASSGSSCRPTTVSSWGGRTAASPS